MNTWKPSGKKRCPGYMLMEALVYIGLVVVVLGIGYAVMYRCVENAVVLRRNAEDMAAALNAGERWRADVRASRQAPQVENSDNSQTVRLMGDRGEVIYHFETNTITRCVQGQPWIRLLTHVRTSEMKADPRQKVNPWQWDVELLPRLKGYVKPGRVRPLFTFTAVPGREANP